jgi:hypothetical protein
MKVSFFTVVFQLWQPTEETKEMAVIFEDDLTVSPFFYRYLKNVHAKYGSVPYIIGIPSHLRKLGYKV